MRRIILLLAFATLLFGGASRSWGVEPVSTAAGLIRVKAGHDSPSAETSFLWQLLVSNSLRREAVAKVSAEAASEAPEFSDVAKVKFESDASGVMDITVESYKERVPADKLLEALVGVLNNRLRELTMAEQEAAVVRFSEENARVKKLAAELRKQHEALMMLAALHGVEIDPALAAQKRLRIESEMQSLEVQLQGLKARREIIEHQIAQLAETVAKDPADEAIVKALRTRIEVQRAALNRMRESNKAFAGTVTKLDIVEAEAKLLEAEAELPKYRREAAEMAGGRRIAQLKTRLDDAAIETAEVAAKRKVLKEQLERARSSSSQMATKRIELELLEREYRHRAEELGKLRAGMQQVVPPVVTFIPLD